MQDVTLATIARKTGVSVSTVSRVLGGKAVNSRISKETANLVRSAARALGYVPANVAQRLRNGGQKRVGLILPSIANPFFAEMAGVIISELDKLHYATIIYDTMESEERFLEYLMSLSATQVDGIIAVPSGNDPSVPERIGRQIPMVLLDRYYDSTDLPFVSTNNFKGGYDATKSLLDRGYRNIVCIQGARDSVPNLQRVNGYLAAIDECHETLPSLVVGSEFSVQGGYLETKLLLAGDRHPDAIFALSNNIMLGSLKAIREVGLRIPEDVAIIAYDDNLYMDYITPVISRISQPVDDMAKLAVKILMDRISGSSSVHSKIQLSPALIPGDSI